MAGPGQMLTLLKGFIRDLFGGCGGYDFRQSGNLEIVKSGFSTF